MRRIINTFRYGEVKVKAILLLTILSGLASVGLVTAAMVLRNLIFFFGAIIGLFVTMSLAQTFAIHENDGCAAHGDAGDDADSKQKPKKEKKEKLKKVPQGKSEENSEEKKEEKTYEKPQKEAGEEAEQRSSEMFSPEPVNENAIDSYDKKKLKRTMHKYKVKRDHRMAIIDRCDSLSIYQTPAFIWVQDNRFNMLLIEKEPRHISLPVHGLNEIIYLKNIPSNEMKDYAVFKDRSVITEMFRPYLPDYAHSTVIDDLTAYKNLYGIGQGIYFTNRSAANLFDLLSADFVVEDKVTMSKKVNIFFKNAYKANILLRDNVIDANGYADRISGILEDMAESTVSNNEFKDTLGLMIKNKLITQEFASYYTEIRDKIRR